ncbi:16752_t:CDS:1, partial [Cetraspora pellucida]
MSTSTNTNNITIATSSNNTSSNNSTKRKIEDSILESTSNDTKKSKTDHEGCGICLNDIEDPFYLVCKHKFCIICTKNFFISSRNNATSCPYCRKVISIEEKD